MSLRRKFTLFASLLVLIVVFGSGFGLYVAEKRYLFNRIQASQEELVSGLAQVGRDAIAGRSELVLSSYLSLIRRSRSLAYAMVLDIEGRIIAHSNVVLVGRKPTDPAALRAAQTHTMLRQVVQAENDAIIDLSMPIYFEGRRIGVARIGYSRSLTDGLIAGALAEARNRVLLSGALALLAGLIGAALLARYIARPIRRLRDGADKIGRGSLDHRIPVESSDEIGELARDFNVMAEKLQELDRLKQDFVSNVTHELRSPLTSLRGYVEFLLRGDAGPLNEEQADFLIVVKNNGARLAKFIDTLLDVAKIEARKIELHREPVDLNGLWKEMTVLFRPQAEEKSITLSASVEPGTPKVWADADKLNEVVINLLSNAFKFTPENGRITLSARPDGDNVRLTVADTGPGIPPESLETVFNKFEQVKPTEGLVRKTKGTGLGLTIVKGFVEAHGGRVWIESQPGEGTSVHVTLPPSEEEPLEDYAEDDGVEVRTA